MARGNGLPNGRPWGPARRCLGIGARLTAWVLALLCGLPQAALAAGTARDARALTQVQMQNVHFRVAPNAALDIVYLRGEMAPTRRGPPTFDAPGSFEVRIRDGTIAIADSTLTWLMNNKVLNYPGAPLAHVQIRDAQGTMRLKGHLTHGLRVPVEIDSEVQADANGKIRLRPTSVKAAGLSVRGLMHLLGLSLASQIRFKPSSGVTVEGDAIVLDPQRLVPPPVFKGKVRAARVENGRLVLAFGAGSGAHGLTIPAHRGQNFMYFRGGVVRFGKLTMTDTDLLIVDETPRDPFDFYMAHYLRQLVAGESHTTRTLGLIVEMPDSPRAEAQWSRAASGS